MTRTYSQLAVPFKIYADFESLLKIVIKIMLLALKKIKYTFLAVSLIKLCVLMINLASQLFFTEDKIQFIDSLKQFLKSTITAKE